MFLNTRQIRARLHQRSGASSVKNNVASSDNLETGGRGSKHTLINIFFSHQVWVRSLRIQLQ